MSEKIDIPKVLKGEKILVLVLVGVFLAGILSGYLTFEQSKEELMPILKGMVRTLLTESKLQTSINIFMNNMTATLAFLVTGFTMIIPLLIVFSNGYMFGFILKLMEIQDLGWIDFLKAVIPHSIFELPAFFLSAVLGIRIGIGLITASGRRRNEFVRRTKEGIFIYLTVVIPLLILAALVEAFITFELVLG